MGVCSTLCLYVWRCHNISDERHTTHDSLIKLLHPFINIWSILCHNRKHMYTEYKYTNSHQMTTNLAADLFFNLKIAREAFNKNGVIGLSLINQGNSRSAAGLLVDSPQLWILIFMYRIICCFVLPYGVILFVVLFHVYMKMQINHWSFIGVKQIKRIEHSQRPLKE